MIGPAILAAAIPLCTTTTVFANSVCRWPYVGTVVIDATGQLAAPAGYVYCRLGRCFPTLDEARRYGVVVTNQPAPVKPARN